MHRRHHIGAVLVALLILTFIVSAHADSRSGDYSYKLNKDGDAVITKYNGNATELIIPDTLDGHSVVEIGKQAFYSSEIEKLTIPSSVTTIGRYAFAFSDDLAEITTYASLIKDHAFTYCSDLESITFLAERTMLEEQALYSCESLETIKGTLYNPGSYSVAFCEDLREVTIAGEYVDDHAFTYCSSLKTVKFITENIAIKEQAFYSCDQLTTVTGKVANIESYAFAFDSKLSDITIVGETIKDHAFTYCKKLKSVTLLTPYVDIEEQAFYSCGKLETVTGLIGNVGSYAFGFCEKLSSLDIAGTEIEDDAFTYCSKLFVRVPNNSDVISAIKSAKVHYTTTDELSVRTETVDSRNTDTSGSVPDNVPAISELSNEEWICPNCGNTVKGNFCNNCGAKKPAEETTTPAITTAPTVAPTAAPTPKPENRSSIELTLDSVVRYMLSPNDSSVTVSIIDMGEGTFTARSSKGKSYLGMVEDDGDSYVIELMSTGGGESYSTEDAPYDYNSPEFKNVLNYLLQDDGKTIVSIIPMYGTMLSTLDSSGDSYLVEILYSEAMIMIGLLSM